MTTENGWGPSAYWFFGLLEARSTEAPRTGLTFVGSETEDTGDGRRVFAFAL